MSHYFSSYQNFFPFLFAFNAPLTSAAGGSDRRKLLAAVVKENLQVYLRCGWSLKVRNWFHARVSRSFALKSKIEGIMAASIDCGA